MNDSYRIVVDMLNRVLHRNATAKIRCMTTNDRITVCGLGLSEAYKEEARNILSREKVTFNSEGKIEASNLPEPVVSPNTQATLSPDEAKDIIEDYNSHKDKECDRIKDIRKIGDIEKSSGNVCYISIDDVGVKFQRDSRADAALKDGKYVENTVIHIQTDNFQYCITAIGMQCAFRLLFAFLLENKLMENRRLVFFTDGAMNIFNHIESFFGFREHTVILDWFHMRKRIKELMSMAIKGKIDKKREIIRDLLRILYAGNIDDATAYLQKFDPKRIKNSDKLQEAIDYLNRKSPFVPCYALRAKTHLRISSNPVEKANDLIVAKRQKHNGMSWSKAGSGALAVITAAKRNGVLVDWVKNKHVTFKLVA